MEHSNLLFYTSKEQTDSHFNMGCFYHPHQALERKTEMFAGVKLLLLQDVRSHNMDQVERDVDELAWNVLLDSKDRERHGEC